MVQTWQIKWIRMIWFGLEVLVWKESLTQKVGTCSHAEGSSTIASGNYSHAEDKYNIKDAFKAYVHIVGNGTSDLNHSNAHTLDWDENAWFAGDVYTGATSRTDKDEGSKKLATEEYVNNSIAAANVKSSYQYAVEGGYTGTEEEFSAKLAELLGT